MVSIVIPVFNEASLIHELVSRLVASISPLDEVFELIFVDDGSEDDSVDQLLKLKATHPQIKILQLSRNFGHQAALTAGLEYAKGDFVGMMDADLQDPPELFHEMHSLLAGNQFDVAVGYRNGRREAEGKRVLITLFHWLFKHMSQLDNIEQTGHFCLLSRSAVNALLSMHETQRYLPGLRSFIGFRQARVHYVRQDRSSGSAKMSTAKLFSLAGDAMFSFSKLPLRFCLYLGLMGVLASLGAGIHVLISKVMGWAPLGWSSTTISIYFLGSIQLMFMGVLGEYIFRTYKESQNRPMYFIRKITE